LNAVLHWRWRWTLWSRPAGGGFKPPQAALSLPGFPDTTNPGAVQVEVVLVGKSKRRMLARVATSEERARLWLVVTADQELRRLPDQDHAGIPLVLLEPATEPPTARAVARAA
jgi:hypothetical protein